MLTTYTTYDDIRAALGVSTDELEDETLGLQLYEDALTADFDDISLELMTTFATVSAELNPTSNQTRFLKYARLFATYSVARTLLTSLPMFAPRSVEDGKARMERSDNPHRDTVKAVSGEYSKWRDRLEAAFLLLGQTTTVRTSRSYLSVVSPGADPVTGV